MKRILAMLLCLLMCSCFFSCEKEPERSGRRPSTSRRDPSIDTETETHRLERKAAREMLEEVLKNQRTLKDSSGKTVYFQDIFYWSGYDVPTQAILDLDQDGIEEMMFRNYSSYIVILHYENGQVYGYKFNGDSVMSFYTDGSYAWRVYDSTFDINEYGVSRISFVDGALKFEEISRTEFYSNTYLYYLDGVEVTSAEYQAYQKNNPKTVFEFSPLDMSLLDAGEALEMASEYWGITQGSFDEETGYRYRMSAYREGGDYRVCLYWLVDNSDYIHLECILVDLETGEISIPKYPDGKG